MANQNARPNSNPPADEMQNEADLTAAEQDADITETPEAADAAPESEPVSLAKEGTAEADASDAGASETSAPAAETDGEQSETAAAEPQAAETTAQSEPYTFTKLIRDAGKLLKRYERVKKEAQAKPPLRPEAEACAALLKHLEDGHPVRTFPRGEGDAILPVLADLHFLTDKKVIYCANVADDDVTGEGNRHVAALRDYANKQGCAMVVVCAQMEADLAGLSDNEAKEFLESYGLSESSLDRTVALAYDTLGLASFLTAGPKEVRAWTFRKGWKAPKCAGVIHSDFERGFIRAKVVRYEDFVEHGGEQKCRELALLREEGKDYVMQDGDMVEFLFNV